jgi:hypothetical protein
MPRERLVWDRTRSPILVEVRVNYTPDEAWALPCPPRGATPLGGGMYHSPFCCEVRTPRTGGVRGPTR